jgi:predicted transcriptional regulator
MKVGDYSKPCVFSIGTSADIVEAAKLMRDQHVGFLIVYKDGDEMRRPVGVLTDRDVVLQVTAREVNPRSVTVEDVMTRQPVIARATDDLGDALQAMRLAGIRRVPVVDVHGALNGILALDDAIDLVTGLLCDISGSIKSEQRQEWRLRPSEERTLT